MLSLVAALVLTQANPWPPVKVDYGYPKIKPFKTLTVGDPEVRTFAKVNRYVQFDNENGRLVVLFSSNLLTTYDLKTGIFSNPVPLSDQHPSDIRLESGRLVFHEPQRPGFDRTYDLSLHKEGYVPAKKSPRALGEDLSKHWDEPPNLQSLAFVAFLPPDDSTCITAINSETSEQLQRRRSSNGKILAQLNLPPDTSNGYLDANLSPDGNILAIGRADWDRHIFVQLPSLKRVARLYDQGGVLSFDPEGKWAVNHGVNAFPHLAWEGVPTMIDLRSGKRYRLDSRHPQVEGAAVSSKYGLAVTLFNHDLEFYKLPKN